MALKTRGDIVAKACSTCKTWNPLTDCPGVSKILMNVAVKHGAPENKRFVDYVSFFVDQHYVPPNAKGWVDHIRAKGNEATHEITATSEADAKTLIDFAEMLLKLTYELPNRTPTSP